MRTNIVILFASLILIACGTEKRELPFWTIQKENQPISYLVGVTEYLDEEQVTEVGTHHGHNSWP